MTFPRWSCVPIAVADVKRELCADSFGGNAYGLDCLCSHVRVAGEEGLVDLQMRRTCVR